MEILTIPRLLMLHACANIIKNPFTLQNAFLKFPENEEHKN